MKKRKVKAPKKSVKDRLKTMPLGRINALLQTLLLCWLVYRVEGLHKQLHVISKLFSDITTALSQEFLGAKLQFQMAIESILSLFGGSEG